MRRRPPLLCGTNYWTPGGRKGRPWTNLPNAFSAWSSWLSPHCQMEPRPPSRSIAFCGVVGRKPPRQSPWNASHVPSPRPCRYSSTFWIARRRYTGPGRFSSGKLGLERRPTGSPSPGPPPSLRWRSVSPGVICSRFGPSGKLAGLNG